MAYSLCSVSCVLVIAVRLIRSLSWVAWKLGDLHVNPCMPQTRRSRGCREAHLGCPVLRQFALSYGGAGCWFFWAPIFWSI